MDMESARAKLFQSLRREINDDKVLDVMVRIPRHQFVPKISRHLAYEDIPLPIEEGQTISQPYIVALMTSALELKGTEKVLEIGAGSGYQAAILAELARHVVTVERHRSLADSARNLLKDLGYTNVEVHLSEKTLGWPDEAPYDAIIVTAAAPKIPQELIDQLVDGGCMVIPVGSRYDQDLVKLTKRGDKTSTKSLGACRFVPLIGEGAWTDQ